MNIQRFITDELYELIGIAKKDVYQITDRFVIHFKINGVKVELSVWEFDEENMGAWAGYCQDSLGYQRADFFKISHNKDGFYPLLRRQIELLRGYPEFNEIKE